jgi:hypothetical protein
MHVLRASGLHFLMDNALDVLSNPEAQR